MAKTRTALDNELREKAIENFFDFLQSENENPMLVAGNVIALPVLDSEHNEAWLEITIKVPKGARLGKGEGFAGYDGYELAATYQTEQAAKKAAAIAAAAAKEKKISKKKTSAPTAETTPPTTGEGE